MAKYLCRNCDKWIELDWWEAHHGRCKSPISWGWLIFLLLLILGAANLAYGDQINEEKDWVKGGVVTAIKADGGCIFKPFIKVGDTENNPDDDASQILGYEPGNVQIDRKGKVVWERVRESVFIPMNGRKVINGRHCKCPPWNGL